jgi:predicted nucleotidyltransferase
MRRILDAALNASSKHLLDLRDNIGQDRMMDQSTIVARLREYEGELKAAGIEHLLLHGSYARGTTIREASDVDVIADFDQAKRLSLIGRVHLENRLTDILGVKADLADRAMLRPEVLERAQHEAILVF